MQYGRACIHLSPRWRVVHGMTKFIIALAVNPIFGYTLNYVHYIIFKVKTMEDTLKRLLIVETEAEQLVAKANSKRETIIQQALEEAHQMEVQFKTKLPDFHAGWLKKAQVRANQTVAELQKRYEEKQEKLRNLADENQAKALQAALQLLMQVGQ